MKAKIYFEDKTEPNGFGEIEIKANLRDPYVFDGYYADIIKIQNVELHGVKDLDDFIKMLESSRPCFQSGNRNRNYFE